MSFDFTFRSQQPTTSNEEAQKSFECDVCGKVFHGKTNTRQHVEIHARFATHKWSFCGKSFKFRTNLRSHITLQHSEANKRFDCEICGVKSETKLARRVHLKNHKNKKPFECSICGKWFKPKTSFVGSQPSVANSKFCSTLRFQGFYIPDPVPQYSITRLDFPFPKDQKGIFYCIFLYWWRFKKKLKYNAMGILGEIFQFFCYYAAEKFNIFSRLFKLRHINQFGLFTPGQKYLSMERLSRF